tara:strand:- start:218 stop:646 length:429 start_codon:yes stop_codon:yes gene_type:complete
MVLDSILNIGGKLIDKLIPDPAAAAQAQLELAKLAQAGELDKLANEVKDRGDARNRELQIATSEAAPLLNKVVTPVLALGSVILSFALFAVLIFIDVQPEAKDILVYILGVLSAAITQILSYYFGSSVGSKDKDEQLKGLSK